MALGSADSDPESVQDGPRSHNCCGSPLQVVALTSDAGARGLVELIRCRTCGLSSWRLDGAEVDKPAALGALSRAYAPSAPHRRAGAHAQRPRGAASPPATDPARSSGQLAELLAGWQVLGKPS